MQHCLIEQKKLEAEKETQIKQFVSTLPAPNIAVVGLTGVGKSSLINAIFGKPVAPTGAGETITTERKMYSSWDFNIDVPVNIYDSPGYEAGTGEEPFVLETVHFLEEKCVKGPGEQIHLIWYLISAPGARLKRFDVDIINCINKNLIPAIIILSQCDRASLDEKSKLHECIRKAGFSKVYDIIELAAFPLSLADGEKICRPFGIEELLEQTVKLLPEIYVDALLMAQKVDIASKRILAWKYVKEASIGCFGGGAIPLPGTAPLSAIAALGYMYGQIMTVYGYTKFNVALGISGMTLGGAVTLTIDGIADLFSATFPGVSVFTGAAAGAFVMASGMAFAKTCERLALGKVSGSEDEVKNKLREIFREEFEKFRNLKVNKPSDFDNAAKHFLSS